MTRIQTRRLPTRSRRAPWTRQRQSRAQFLCPPPDGATAQTIRIEHWPATCHSPRPVPLPTPRPTRGSEREVYGNRSQGRQSRSCPPAAIRVPVSNPTILLVGIEPTLLPSLLCAVRSVRTALRRRLVESPPSQIPAIPASRRVSVRVRNGSETTARLCQMNLAIHARRRDYRVRRLLRRPVLAPCSLAPAHTLLFPFLPFPRPWLSGPWNACVPACEAYPGELNSAGFAWFRQVRKSLDKNTSITK